MSRRRLITAALAAGALATTLAAGPALAASHAATSLPPTPGSTVQIQQEAGPIIPAPPAGPTCTETVLTHDFANSYYAPGTATYTPPTDCPGPWSQVVLSLTGSVNGVQYDRSLSVVIGGVLMLRGSTSEPCCIGADAVQWSISRVVTEYSATLAHPQPVSVELNNIVNSTYTGIYHVVVALTFHEAPGLLPVAARPSETAGAPGGPPTPGSPGPAPSPGGPVSTTPPTATGWGCPNAGPGGGGGPGDGGPGPGGQACPPEAATTPPDAVVGLFPTALGGMQTLSRTGQLASASVTFPDNLVRLDAQLFADGHGPCEEFWWSEPEQCGVGGPFRDVAVWIDGTLAGVAPVYPVLFTGASGPGLWEPIPSPRAWDLRPYRVDLTPFVGELTNGQPHTVSLGVLGAAYTPGDYWRVGANLLEWTGQPGAAVSGALQAVDAPNPAMTLTEAPNIDAEDVVSTASMSGELSWTGQVSDAGQTWVTTVSDTLSAQNTGTAGTEDSRWGWRETSRTTGGPQPVSATRTATYGLSAGGITSYSFVDDASDLLSLGTRDLVDTASAERMTTTAVGLAFNGVEREAYQLQESPGTCRSMTLDAAAGEIVSATPGTTCPDSSPVA